MKEAHKKNLLDILEKMQGKNFLVVGDLILDRYIWGKVDRISPEAPVPVIEVKKTEDRLGGAGNVIRNLRNLGIQATLCGVIGEDEAGSSILNLLAKEGVQSDSIVLERTRPTSVKTRVIAHPQQIVRIDKEEKSPLPSGLQSSLSTMVESLALKHDAIILSDYAKGVLSPEIFQKLGKLHKEKKLGRDTIPFIIDPHPDNAPYYNSFTMAKPNRREAEIASGIKIVDKNSAILAAKKLREIWSAEMMMITLGDLGLVIVDEKEPVSLDTVAKQVFDVSGAGDTVTAVFTGALCAGASLEDAGLLSNIAAGVVISKVGTAPIDKNSLIHEIIEDHN